MSKPEPDAPSLPAAPSEDAAQEHLLPEGSDEGGEGNEEGSHEIVERPGSAFRKRLSSILLVPGLGLALLLFHRESPRETELVLKLEGRRAAVTQIEASLSAQSDSEQIAGALWSFSPGNAPRTVRTVVKIPAGEWLLSTSLQLEEGGRQESARRVKLEGGTLTVPVRVEAGE